MYDSYQHYEIVSMTTDKCSVAKFK